jgi:hypothetical protein
MPGGRPLRPITEYSNRELAVGLLISTVGFAGLATFGVFNAWHHWHEGNSTGLWASILGALAFFITMLMFDRIYIREFRRRRRRQLTTARNNTGPTR